jgi:threonine/homoserine/homoserine lactone efflux protein
MPHDHTNPFVFAFWMTVMGFAAFNFGYRTRSFFVYFMTVVATALVFDIIKSCVFSRVTITVKTPVMAWINRGMGVALAAAGIVIICQAVRP